LTLTFEILRHEDHVCLFCSIKSSSGHPPRGTYDCLPVTGVVSGATRAGLLQCSVGWHSITPCMVLAIDDERRRMARLRIIKVLPHHAAPMPFGFKSICIPLHLMNCLFAVPASQPTGTELFQSPLYGSGTIFCSTSHLLHHFLSSALGCRHTSSNFVTRNYCCCAVVIYGHVNHSYLLTYILLTCTKLMR